jgi:hypothetical protein
MRANASSDGDPVTVPLSSDVAFIFHADDHAFHGWLISADGAVDLALLTSVRGKGIGRCGQCSSGRASVLDDVATPRFGGA